MQLVTINRPGKIVSLDDVPTHGPKRLDRDAIENRLLELETELSVMQEMMWGARKHSVLVVLQGRDTSGKDGTVKRVMGALNPRGVHVVSYGVPTQEEAEHDFLWRVHRHAPRLGEFSIFNRSHYEDVLVPRVHHLIEKSAWRARYGHIVDFEQMLTDHNCIVLKFFLHISKAEQKRRLLDRENDATKAWKLDPNDWRERRYWKPFTKAYEDVFTHSASETAPWHIVPADDKPYRNLVVAEAIVEALRPHAAGWVKTLTERGKLTRRALRSLREGRDG
jgi:PPK2 family polyphosphate:nucleotide phosphotransferase